jgi:hypothetical protein
MLEPGDQPANCLRVCFFSIVDFSVSEECLLIFIFMKDTKASHHANDCGAKGGDIHNFGCDMERYPKCRDQFAFCECKDNDLRFYTKIIAVRRNEELAD